MQQVGDIFADDGHFDEQAENVPENPQNDERADGEPEPAGDARSEIGDDSFFRIRIIFKNVLDFGLFERIGDLVQPLLLSLLTSCLSSKGCSSTRYGLILLMFIPAFFRRAGAFNVAWVAEKASRFGWLADESFIRQQEAVIPFCPRLFGRHPPPPL